MRLLLTASQIGGLPGRTVADALARGWREANPAADVQSLGVSDGDRGFLDAIEGALGGARAVVVVARNDGVGNDGDRPARVPVEVLQVGATLYLAARDVLGDAETATTATASRGTSFGVGEVVADAADRGVSRLVVGAGPSATLDAGVGMLRALAGDRAAQGAFGGLADPDDLAPLVGRARERLGDLELVLAASDPVAARGLRGAAARLIPALGPQAAQDLDARLTPWVPALEAMVPRRRDLLAGRREGAPSSPGAADPFAGVGGGLGLAVIALGGRTVPGAAFCAQETGLAARVGGCDLVVVAAERIDPVEADRGVIAAVAGAAASHGIAVLGLGLTVRLDRRGAARAGLSATATLEPAATATAAVAAPAEPARRLTPDELAALVQRHARAWRW